MEAVMGSSSPSPYLKLVSSRDTSMGFLCLRDDLMSKSLLRIPLHHSRNHLKNKEVDSKLSISVSSTHRGVRPASLSSSHTQTQAEVDNHELLVEQSPNGYTKPRTVCVRFQLQKECSFGQNFLIVGDDPIFGLWDPTNAIPLTWSGGHVWTVDLDIPIGKCIKFKFIMQESNGIYVWQPGPDRFLQCWDSANVITLCEDWENPDSRRIIESDPTLNQVEESGDIQTVVGNDQRIQEELMDAMKEVLVSDQGVPVLVPGLGHLPIMDTDQQESVHEAPKDEHVSVNGTTVMASSKGAEIANDLKLPELNLKRDANTSNSNPRPSVSSIYENQDCCKNKCQETEQVGDQQKQDPQATQAKMKGLLLNDIRWGTNVVEKLLSIFGI